MGINAICWAFNVIGLKGIPKMELFGCEQCLIYCENTVVYN